MAQEKLGELREGAAEYLNRREAKHAKPRTQWESSSGDGRSRPYCSGPALACCLVVFGCAAECGFGSQLGVEVCPE